jgi:ubiquinone/menaquinone biosynthesis C-methylase UbiE
MECTLHHADAEILVEDTDGDKNKITVKLKNNNIFMPCGTFETTYPLELIEKILSIKGPAYLCDEIMRDESPEYIERHIHYDVFGYVNKEEFRGINILDFGCGSAASTMVLSRMLPSARIVGVELEPSLLEIAELRSNHYKVGDRVKFFLSPDGNSLPKDIGDFDYIFLNAVYEHLLPEERKIVLPLLWNHLKPNGVLFISETPYRWFPVENHTTNGLIFINYMPDSIAMFYARHFSKIKLINNSWPTLLRKGIRGGSIREIVRILKNHSYPPVLLTPNQRGMKDQIDMWSAQLGKSRYLVFLLLKLVKITTGEILLPTLSLSIQKPGDV